MFTFRVDSIGRSPIAGKVQVVLVPESQVNNPMTTTPTPSPAGDTGQVDNMVTGGQIMLAWDKDSHPSIDEVFELKRKK